MTWARRCDAMAVLRGDVDQLSLPSDSEMTVIRVCKQRRLCSQGPQGEPGDPPHSPSLVNLAEGDENCLEPLTSWVRRDRGRRVGPRLSVAGGKHMLPAVVLDPTPASSYKGVSPRGTALELGDVLLCCPPRSRVGAWTPPDTRSRSPPTVAADKESADLEDDVEAARIATQPDRPVEDKQVQTSWWRPAWDWVAACAGCSKELAEHAPARERRLSDTRSSASSVPYGYVTP
ncbi:uncharacterized protein LOC113214312 [Frankliniella occidentalis]|uniref:Uncharacterized protein LOC113214312 n=1 Tax=Frankliniella occidentalis TaxID=133901 RepID=A0A9C6XVI8_FRAOC|nr:uncharacterized protein LOC113214312 [Frankliniella occidentalis]